MHTRSDGGGRWSAQNLNLRAASLGNRGPVLSIKTGSIGDSYEIGKKIGEGHFGSTHVVTSKKTGKRYAMKCLSKARLFTLGTPLQEVQREVAMLYHLQGHPNIVEMVDVFEDSRYVCIVMELCEGGELYDRIVDKGGYCERDAARLVHTMVSVVAYCHSLGVVHRDLKPENFLFLSPSEDSPLKAIDFGLSIFFKKGQPISAGMAGSPLYLAPEMVRTQGTYYTEAVDVWSAGVIMYMLLSGYCPFPTDLPTMDALFESIMFDPIDYEEEPWPQVSKEAKNLLQGMLERNPTKRLTAEQVLAHPWLIKSGVAPDTPLDSIVVHRLQKYSGMNKFRKLASRIVAQHMSKEQILGLKELFKQIDKDSNGTISLEELQRGLEEMGSAIPTGDVEEMFSAIDVDESKALDMEEFFAATLGLHRIIREENLLYAFEYIDKDRSGYITQEELEQVCKEFGMTSADVEGMFSSVDTNKDNKIDYAEFVALMHQKDASGAMVAKTHSLGKDRKLLRDLGSSRSSDSSGRGGAEFERSGTV